MPRAITVFVLLIAVVGCGRAPSQAEDEEAPEEEFPTVIPPDDGTYYPTVGAKWVYRSSNGRVYTHVVTSVEDKGGAKRVTAGWLKKNGEVKYLFTTKTSADGLYLVETFSRNLDPPEVLLKLPHVAGNTWEGEVGPDSFTAHGPEEVSVPAGTFKAIRVVERRLQSTRTKWYAPGIGVVKDEIDSHWPPERPEGKSGMVLKRSVPERSNE
jgi:hypothetical protein